MLFLVKVILTVWVFSVRGQERECIVPDIEQNLIVQPQKEKYVIGDVLKFSCRNRLHSLVGPDSLQCYHFGWSPNPPTCKEKVQSCDQPPQLPNGTVAEKPKEEYGHGEVVEYVCNPRFLLKGAKKIQCVDGEWTPLPVCVEEHSTCGDVPELEDGEVVSPARPSYHHGDSVVFTCREDFTMIGYSLVTCIRGTWTQLPQCIEAPRCPPPPQIPNSQHMTVTVNYQEGEKISILCQENFLIQEGEEIVCQDGRWQSIPRCVETICSSPPSYGNAILIGWKKKSYRSGEQVTYRCPDYYQMDGSNAVQCRGGIWIGRPTCKDPSCGSPPLVLNAFIPGEKPRYRPGDTARYECTNSLGLFGNAVVTCLSGNWTDPPECKDSAGKCGPPPVIDNGDITTYPKRVYAPGSSVEYRCQAFHELEGNRRITCRDGEWSEPPICLYFSSGSPPEEKPNPFIPDKKRRYRHGDTARYQSRHSFSLSGDKAVTYLSGKWTDPAECKEPICSSPPSYGNAILIGRKKKSYRSGEQVTYRCPDYYQMDGSNAVQCRGGIWIGRPTCKDVSCGSPPPVQNAFIPGEKPRYRHGDTARYECRHRLGLLGNAVVTCLSGKWTDPPECKETICSSPPSYGNAILIGQPKNSYRSGEQVTYRCPDYYQVDGSNAVKCRGGIWIGTPTCKDVSCGSPPPVQNAFISGEKPRYRPGDTARYECTNSLGLFGNAVVTCLSGKWTDPPECKEPICSSPPSYGNAILIGQPKRSYRSGEQVTYRCPEYYQMDGSNAVQCRGGIWIGTPTCKDFSCGSPPPVQNASISDEKPRYRHGDTARYECTNSLGLLGNAVVTCLSGKWTDPPECKEPICSSPPSYGNAILIGQPKRSYRSGEQVTYRCPEYYQMDGSNAVQCRGGIWIGTPTCKDFSCGSPPPVQNASISDEKPRYRHGDTARYECTNSLGLLGNAVVTCLSGKWTDPPECKEPICSSPPSYGNAILIGQPKNSYRSGEQVTYRCPDYYQMDGSHFVECTGGIWIGTPTCKDFSCGSPPPVQNASISDEKPRYRHGDTARYECTNSLGLLGNAVVTCLSGKWTDPPECKEPICSSPPSYGNAILIGQPKNSYRSGEQVTYRCPDYYQMDGSHFVECTGGIWIGTPTCKDFSCGSPPQVQNASISDEKPRYRHGDTARYECTNSLGLLGNAVVTCLSGKWTDPPECKDSAGKCGPPPVIDNGDITTYPSPLYAPGSSVEYQCQAYYVLEGNRRITCHDGEWSEPPKCLESTGKCGPPPVIDNGDITTYPSPLYAPGSSVEYQCQAYYELDGNRIITCRDGEWSEPPKCLDPCVISEEVMEQHNIALKWSHEKKLYSRTNDYTEFRCRPGYHKVSPASAFRAQCREGKLEYPICA